MSEDDKAAGDLAPRSWRNYHRSRRASEMRHDLEAVDESLIVTNWWETDDPDAAS